MRIPQIHPITNPEFVEMMVKCRPPMGWPSTIAVASSAGPDSTCLLFLLRRMIDQKPKNRVRAGADLPLPDRILSLHVDHNLQSDAEKMAHAARAAARTYKSKYDELRVRWGEPPFPARPRACEGKGLTVVKDEDENVDAGEGEGESSAIESVARTARYRLLFDAMVRRGAHVLATGHHADDQVETVLMRLGQGSSVLGLGGMRPSRRFGMALGKGEGEDDFGWFGLEGLSRWIVRPLLNVPKDRILATCDLHGVRYVLDRTNFQPDLTLRNAIRHLLASNEQKRHTAEPVESLGLPPVLAEQIARTETASENLKLPIPIDIMASRESLYAAVRNSSRNLFDIESRASTYLSRFSVQAPPGTFILTSDRLSTTVTDTLVQLAMVLRVLRYISPYPWGTMRAQAGRRSESLQRIVQRVWDPNPASDARTRFETGGKVLWTPVRICPDGRLRYERPKQGERIGWLASRAPPSRHSRTSFDRDISAKLRSRLKRRAEVLYDNRFLITFRLEDIQPGDPIIASIRKGSGKVMLVLGGRWLWPQVVWRHQGEDVVIACISAPELDWYQPAPGVRKNYSMSPPSKIVQEARLPWQDIVDFNFIRVLDEH